MTDPIMAIGTAGVITLVSYAIYTGIASAVEYITITGAQAFCQFIW